MQELWNGFPKLLPKHQNRKFDKMLLGSVEQAGLATFSFLLISLDGRVLVNKNIFSYRTTYF